MFQRNSLNTKFPKPIRVTIHLFRSTFPFHTEDTTPSFSFLFLNAGRTCTTIYIIKQKVPRSLYIHSVTLSLGKLHFHFLGLIKFHPAFYYVQKIGNFVKSRRIYHARQFLRALRV